MVGELKVFVAGVAQLVEQLICNQPEHPEFSKDSSSPESREVILT